MNDEYHYDKKPLDDVDKENTLADVRKHLNVSNNLRRLDENNPHEQARKFRMLKQNPPNPDFMKVDLHRGKDGNGNDKLYSRHVTLDDGRSVWIEHDPFFVFSPYVGFMANIAKAPMNAMDVLFDETELVAIEEKNAFKPEKRKDENKWGWIMFVVICILGAVGGGGFLLMRMLG